MESQLTITEKLIDVQSKLKAPKNQLNDYAHFKYRSCEDILEAVKPLIKEQGLSLILNDDIVLIGDRYYVKATVLLSDGVTTISNTAFAREDISKKGMDASQVTGTTSSYARKYALNGLFLIDDSKDTDTNEHKLLKDKAEKEQQEEEERQQEEDEKQKEAEKELEERFILFKSEVDRIGTIEGLGEIAKRWDYRAKPKKWKTLVSEKNEILKEIEDEEMQPQ